MRKNSRIVFCVQGALIATLYVILTLISNSIGLASGVIQIRLSEALMVLPIFMPSAVPGLFIGCILSNILTGSIFLDVVFGSLATLIGAIFTRLLRNYPKFAILPPILSNTLIIPFILSYAYNFEGSLLYFALTVGIGEIISCGILGYFLAKSLSNLEQKLFNNE